MIFTHPEYAKDEKNVGYYPTVRKLVEKTGIPVLCGLDAEYDAGSNPDLPLPMNIKIVPVEQITEWLSLP